MLIKPTIKQASKQETKIQKSTQGIAIKQKASKKLKKPTY